ncbi:hypothetical protein SLA2020_406900, partial [Shorea laevis]
PTAETGVSVSNPITAGALEEDEATHPPEKTNFVAGRKAVTIEAEGEGGADSPPEESEATAETGVSVSVPNTAGVLEEEEARHPPESTTLVTGLGFTA